MCDDVRGYVVVRLPVTISIYWFAGDVLLLLLLLLCVLLNGARHASIISNMTSWVGFSIGLSPQRRFTPVLGILRREPWILCTSPIARLRQIHSAEIRALVIM